MNGWISLGYLLSGSFTRSVSPFAPPTPTSATAILLFKGQQGEEGEWEKKGRNKYVT